MILARNTNAIRTQNWFAVALEFVIVIAGVVIGFQVTAWNADRIERSQEAAILCQLAEEFTRIETDFEQHLSDAEGASTLASQLSIAASRGMTLEQLSQFDTAAITMRAPPGGSATYDQLISNGELGLISSQNLRVALTEFGEQYDRHIVAGAALSLNTNQQGGQVLQALSLISRGLETLPGELREEMETFVRSREFAMATQSIETFNDYNFRWKRISLRDVRAVNDILAEQTRHCTDAS